MLSILLMQQLVNLDQPRLKPNKIQEETTDAIQLYDLNAELARDSNFEFNSFNFGGASNRDDTKINIGECHAAINSLYVQKDDKTSHHRIHINHKINIQLVNSFTRHSL